VDEINDIAAALLRTEWEGEPVFIGGRAGPPRSEGISTAAFDRAFFGGDHDLEVKQTARGVRCYMWGKWGGGWRDQTTAVSDDITTPEELLTWARMVANLTQG
jgi:hypothetical protein